VDCDKKTELSGEREDVSSLINVTAWCNQNYTEQHDIDGCVNLYAQKIKAGLIIFDPVKYPSRSVYKSTVADRFCPNGCYKDGVYYDEAGKALTNLISGLQTVCVSALGEPLDYYVCQSINNYVRDICADSNPDFAEQCRNRKVEQIKTTLQNQKENIYDYIEANVQTGRVEGVGYNELISEIVSGKIFKDGKLVLAPWKALTLSGCDPNTLFKNQTNTTEFEGSKYNCYTGEIVPSNPATESTGSLSELPELNLVPSTTSTPFFLRPVATITRVTTQALTTIRNNLPAGMPTVTINALNTAIATATRIAAALTPTPTRTPTSQPTQVSLPGVAKLDDTNEQMAKDWINTGGKNVSEIDNVITRALNECPTVLCNKVVEIPLRINYFYGTLAGKKEETLGHRGVVFADNSYIATIFNLLGQKHCKGQSCVTFAPKVVLVDQNGGTEGILPGGTSSLNLHNINNLRYEFTKFPSGVTPAIVIGTEIKSSHVEKYQTLLQEMVRWCGTAGGDPRDIAKGATPQCNFKVELPTGGDVSAADRQKLENIIRAIPVHIVKTTGTTSPSYPAASITPATAAVLKTFDVDLNFSGINSQIGYVDIVEPANKADPKLASQNPNNNPVFGKNLLPVTNFNHPSLRLGTQMTGLSLFNAPGNQPKTDTPQLSTLFVYNSKYIAPAVTGLYQVTDWAWTNQTAGEWKASGTPVPGNNFGATGASFDRGSVNQLVVPTTSEPNQNVYAVVLYADSNTITFRYVNGGISGSKVCDTVASCFAGDNAYTITLDNISVSDDIVGRYNDSTNRSTLIKLPVGTQIGTPQSTTDPLVILRANGGPMDVRIRDVYWKGIDMSKDKDYGLISPTSTSQTPTEATTAKPNPYPLSPIGAQATVGSNPLNNSLLNLPPNQFVIASPPTVAPETADPKKIVNITSAFDKSIISTVTYNQSTGYKVPDGTTVKVPTSGYDIGGGYNAMLSWVSMDNKSLVFSVAPDGYKVPEKGYAYLITNFNPNPDLIKAFDLVRTSRNTDPATGKPMFPVLKNGQAIGTSIPGKEVTIMCIRDKKVVDCRGFKPN
jgi:hypothetical protein